MATERINAADDRAAALWVDERLGGVSPQRQAALEAWLAGRPDRQALLDRHERLIADPAVRLAAERVSRQSAAAASSRRASSPRWTGATERLAAGVACALIVGVAVVGVLPRGERFVGTRGEAQAITLVDGSVIRLNGASEVRADLRDDARRLHLKGEGFFEVAPDRRRPFTVEAGEVRVTAVGTRFNVEQHQTPDGPAIEVEVFEGAVDVAPRSGAPLRLKAGERVRVLKGAVRRAVLDPRDNEVALPGWTEGWLELDETTLLSVVDDLHRTTGVTVELSRPDMGEVLVSGRFAYAQPENALAAIARLHGFRLTRKGADRYVLSEG